MYCKAQCYKHKDMMANMYCCDGVTTDNEGWCNNFFLSLFFQTFLSGTIDLNIIGKECKTSEGEAAFSMTEQHTFSTDFL